MRRVQRFMCEECRREHYSPEEAERCERDCREQKLKRDAAKAAEKGWQEKGHDIWWENGDVQHAAHVNETQFGDHDYGKHLGTSDCKYGCGCWMGPTRSGGPVNPFGACPNNPKEKEGEA